METSSRHEESPTKKSRDDNVKRSLTDQPTGNDAHDLEEQDESVGIGRLDAFKGSWVTHSPSCQHRIPVVNPSAMDVVAAQSKKTYM